jgi:hypothetical protein
MAKPKSFEEHCRAILEELAPAHDDEDYSTCASNFARCSICNERVYWMNRSHHGKEHSSTVPPQWTESKCDCRVEKSIEMALAALLQAHAEECERIIGTDDYPHLMTGSAGQARNEIRNQLRSEQREELQQSTKRGEG